MWWLIPAGIVVLAAGTVDLLWTTLGTHGGGPLSAPLTKGMWKTMLAMHRLRPNHRALSFAGSIILFELLGFWVLLIWIGWVLVFTGAHGSIVDAKSGAPVDFATRIFFVGAQMFTSGTAEYNPHGGFWHIITAITAGSGLFAMTLAITYILAVLGAAVEKRTAASFVWDMGGTPERIIARSWDGKQFTDLHNHLVELDTAIELFAEQHLAYPILQYFHAENRRTAAALRIAALYDMLLLIRYGAQEHVRPPQLLLESSMDAIRGLAEVVAKEYVTPSENPPPWPDLGILHAHRIPAVPLEEFGSAVDRNAEVRKRILGMILEAGWTWDDVFDLNLEP